MLTKLKKLLNPKFLSVIAAFLILGWAVGCEPTVRSLKSPGIKVSAAELQIEVEVFIAQYDIRKASLEEQNKLREFILSNALLTAQTGTINPFGLLTGLMALYGVGSAANDTGKAIRKVRKK